MTPDPAVLGTPLTDEQTAAWAADPAERATASLLGELAKTSPDDPGRGFRARLALAAHAVRLAAAVDPVGALRDLDRAESVAWLTDPTLYRRALWDGGPVEVRRLMAALRPAAELYAAASAEREAREVDA
jgi:hypothetical protein